MTSILTYLKVLGLALIGRAQPKPQGGGGKGEEDD